MEYCVCIGGGRQFLLPENVDARGGAEKKLLNIRQKFAFIGRFALLL